MHYITVNATRIQKESTAINNININIILPLKFFPCLTPFQDIVLRLDEFSCEKLAGGKCCWSEDSCGRNFVTLAFEKWVLRPTVHSTDQVLWYSSAGWVAACDNLQLCTDTQHHCSTRKVFLCTRHAIIAGSEGTDPLILNLDTKWS
jgi:hypothetical protein